MEQAGLSTIVLTPTPEFHRAVGIPRSAAIEYPYGRPVGEVGDTAGQTEVITAALSFFESADRPGDIAQLPFTWPEAPKDAHWHPPGMSPIIKMNLDEIKAARKPAP